MSKLVIFAMMIRGRHRGLPYALDRVITLPSDHGALELDDLEDEDPKSKMGDRLLKSGYSGRHEDVEVIHLLCSRVATYSYKDGNLQLITDEALFASCGSSVVKQGCEIHTQRSEVSEFEICHAQYTETSQFDMTQLIYKQDPNWMALVAGLAC